MAHTNATVWKKYIFLARRGPPCQKANTDRGDAEQTTDLLVLERVQMNRATILVRLFSVLLAGSATSVMAQVQTAMPVPDAGDQDRPVRRPDGTPAAVQTGTVSEDGIGDIVVTAQRRNESVQRSSLSIQVVGGESLSASGATQPNELTRLVPGLQVSGGTTSQFYVRGVGDFGVTAIANPAVAINLDNMYIHRPQAVAGNFFDLDRVEVLKGPQGTLYGRNASGGAVNLITAKPRLGSLSGYLQGQVGNYDLFEGEGAINLPVGDTLAVRASFDVVSRDGYLSDGSEDDKRQSVRLQALWQATPDLSLLLRGTYVHLGGVGSGYVLANPLPGTTPWTGSADPRVQASYVARQPPGTPQGFFLTATPDDLCQDIDTYSAAGELTWNAGPVTIALIPTYQHTAARFAVTPSFVYGPGVFGTDGDRTDTSSVELRVTHQGDRLKAVAGAYFYGQDIDSSYGVNSGLIQRIALESVLTTRSYSAFGDLTYSLTDKFRLLGGLRYTSEQRGLEDGRKFGVFPSLICARPTLAGTDRCLLASFSGERTFNKLNWKAGFEYDLAPQSMLYFNASTGFKAGGFNQAVDFTPGSTNTLPFEPETITAYQGGVRNRFLDNRLQVNIEGFYWDYRDLQISQLIIDGQGQTSLATQNAGKARIFGGTLDAVAKPYRSGTFRAAVEYVNSKYLEFNFIQAQRFVAPGSTGCIVTPAGTGAGGALVNLNCAGFELIRSPRWSGNASYTHNLDLANGDTIAATADLSFAGPRWLAADFVPGERADGYAAIGANLTYTRSGGDWSLTAFVRNITKEAIYTGGLQSTFAAGFITTSIAAPRVYGARLRFNF